MIEILDKNTMELRIGESYYWKCTKCGDFHKTEHGVPYKCPINTLKDKVIITFKPTENVYRDWIIDELEKLLK